VSDPRKLVNNLLLLEFQLFVVWQGLPCAASAYSVVRTERFLADRRLLYHPDHVALHESLAGTGKLNVNYVSRNAFWYEKYLAVYMSKAIAFCGNGLYAHILDDLSFFIPFAAHLIS
jgi:hypothetical protein